MKLKFLFIPVLFSFGTISAQTTYLIHIDQPQQEIDNFGASDCWTMYRFGKYATEDNVNKVADLLFSKDFDANGKPLGIGLSLWRMNFGAGSDDNAFGAYRDVRGRTPCIMKKDGTYDLSLDGKCGGQFNMLKKAKERGCEYTLGFVNSPPYFMTRNGETTGNNNTEYSTKLNLDDNGIQNFAEYLSEVLRRTKEEHGVTFDYVAPVNEPEWTANMGENMNATNYDIKKICVALNSRLLAKSISTKILIPESGQIQILYTDRDMDSPYNKYDYGSKIQNFFGNTSSSAYVGDLPTVARIATAHGYWSTYLDGPMVNYRTPMPAVLKQYNTKYWETEWCIGGESLDEFITNQNTADLTINYGLAIARLMHCDLSLANASAWHWWLALTDVPYTDGLLYLRRNGSYNVAYQLSSSSTGSVSSSMYSTVYQEAEVVVPKALWCFGQYSRWIRPGAHRLTVTNWQGVDNIKGMMVSSYQNKDGKLVCVMLNYGTSSVSLNLAISDASKHTFIPYITSSDAADKMRPMTEIETGAQFTMPARSIVTFVEKSASGVSSPVAEKSTISWHQNGDEVTVQDVAGSQIYVYNTAGMLLDTVTARDDEASVRLHQGMNIVVVRNGNGVIGHFIINHK
jgi:O-glycosyl hydrolase